MIEHEYTVIAVHGEGDRETVNNLQRHRNREDIMHLSMAGITKLEPDVDEPPEVIIVLRDEAHNKRIDHPVETWAEVEWWKKTIGWDQSKRHWKLGTKIKVGFGV